MPPRRDRAAPIVRPPPIHTRTIQPGPSQPIGFAIQSRLFFNSEQWIVPLYRDISDLLHHFTIEWTRELERQVQESRRGRGALEVDIGSSPASPPASSSRPLEALSTSPFQVFKRLWVEKGWSLVHLLGVTDGVLRSPWGDSVLRGFAEYLVPDENPLRQIGALFAIFVFCKTQPTSPVQQMLKIDIATLNHLLSFPTRISPALDPRGSSSIRPPPATDVTTVLATLLSRDDPMFHLVPTELYLHPKNLPTVLIRDARERQGIDLIGQKLLGVEEEIEWLRRGERDRLELIRERHKRKIERETRERDRREQGRDEVRSEEGEDPVDEDSHDDHDEGERARASRDRGGAIAEKWLGPVLRTSRLYSAVKSNSARESTPGGGGSSKRSVVRKPRTKLQLEVLRKAEEATMYKVRETGLEGMVETRTCSKRRATSSDRGFTKGRLLDLVRGHNDVTADLGQGTRRRKHSRKSQSLREVETALTLLGEASSLT